VADERLMALDARRAAEGSRGAPRPRPRRSIPPAPMS
jgi:hypothetical protein